MLDFIKVQEKIRSVFQSVYGFKISQKHSSSTATWYETDYIRNRIVISISAEDLYPLPEGTRNISLGKRAQMVIGKFLQEALGEKYSVINYGIDDLLVLSAEPKMTPIRKYWKIVREQDGTSRVIPVNVYVKGRGYFGYLAGTEGEAIPCAAPVTNDLDELPYRVASVSMIGKAFFESRAAAVTHACSSK